MASYTIDGVKFNFDYYDSMLDVEILDYIDGKIYHSIFYSDDDIFMNDTSPMCTSGSLYYFMKDAFNADIHDVDVRIEANANYFYEITITLLMSTCEFAKTILIKYSCDMDEDVEELTVQPSLPQIKKIPSTPPPTPADGYDDVEQCEYTADDCCCKYYPVKLSGSPCKFIADDFQDTESVSTDPDMPSLEDISDSDSDTTDTFIEHSDTPLTVIDEPPYYSELRNVIENIEDKVDKMYMECITVNEHERRISDLAENINDSEKYMISHMDRIVADHNMKIDQLRSEFNEMMHYLNSVYKTLNAYSNVVEKLNDVVFDIVKGDTLESPIEYHSDIRQRRSFVGEF